METNTGTGDEFGNDMVLLGPVAVAVLGRSKYNRGSAEEITAVAGNAASFGGNTKILIAGFAICPSQSTSVMPRVFRSRPKMSRKPISFSALACGTRAIATTKSAEIFAGRKWRDVFTEQSVQEFRVFLSRPQEHGRLERGPTSTSGLLMDE